jgi:Putative zinc-finger
VICHAARDLLSDLVDGALLADDRRELEAHLATCGECARELDTLRQTVALLHRVEPARAPAGFVDRVMEQVAPRPWFRRVLADLLVPLGVRLPAGAAAVAMVAIGAVYVFHRTPELQQAARVEVPGGWGEGARSSPFAAKPVTGESLTGGAAVVRPARPSSEPEPAAPAARHTPASAPTVARPAPPHLSVAPLPQSAPAERRDEPEAHKSGREARSAAPSPATPPPTASPESRDVAAPTEATGLAKRPDSRAEATLRAADTEPKAAAEAHRQRAETPPAAPTMSTPLPTPSAPIPRISNQQSSAEGNVARDLALRAPMERSASPPPPAPGVGGESGPGAARMPMPDVTGRLLPRDRASLPSALAEVVARASGFEAARRAEGGDLVVEVFVARAAYPGFTRDVAGLGEWVVTQEPVSLPPTVRVLIRIAP